MAIKRLTKEDIRKTVGVLNPIGHVVLAFPDDPAASRAADDLQAAGFAPEDVLLYTAAEATPRLRERVRTTSEINGFGYERTLMRRYLAYAEEGAGWIVVYAPSGEAAARVLEVARRDSAHCAVRYHRLASEDLI
jgi:hypothetical protein